MSDLVLASVIAVEAAIIADESCYPNAEYGDLPDETLERLGRWYAIAESSAQYCNDSPEKISILDIGLHTEEQLEQLRTKSKRFARDYSVGEKTAKLTVEAAKISASGRPKTPHLSAIVLSL